MKNIFKPSCQMRRKELKEVNKCIKSLNWSSFKGATEGWNINRCIGLTSKEANKLKPLEVRFLGGKYVRKLEYNFSKKLNSKFAISANSATSCLTLALGALDIEPGDEVIVPCMSYIASATAILTYNAIPVFCEVDENTYCIDINDLKKKISKKTKCIIVVHLGGSAAEIDSILKIAKKLKIKIIEDTSQAPFIKYKNKFLGTYGDVGVFSFTETKTITSGEGGILITNSNNLAQKARLIRNHGEAVADKNWSDKKLINIIGQNLRLTEIQASILIEQLKDLEFRNKQRIKNYQYLKNNLKEIKNLKQPTTIPNSVYTPYIVKWRWQKSQKLKISRDQLCNKLNKLGIPVTKGYGKLLHENEIFVRKIAYGKKNFPWSLSKKKYYYGRGTLKKSEAINKEFIWFKYINYPNTLKEMKKVVKAFKKSLKI